MLGCVGWVSACLRVCVFECVSVCVCAFVCVCACVFRFLVGCFVLVAPCLSFWGVLLSSCFSSPSISLLGFRVACLRGVDCCAVRPLFFC